MTSFFFNAFFRLLASFPLSWLHLLGTLLGRLTFATSKEYATRTQENLTQSGLAKDDLHYQSLLKQSVDEAGKSVAELPWVWGRPLDEVCAQVLSCEGWQHITEGMARGKGVIVLTPHWGCFEVVGVYVAQHFPMTNLYRSPKQAWLESMMRAGRERGLAHLATADIKGVRTLFKALKRGEVIGLLPDQVPSNGEGEWVNFFGRPAYTMTLSARLAQTNDATVVLVYAERLPRGQGYAVRVDPLALDFSLSVPLQINAALERVIANSPAQYAWSYNRYKVPSGVLPPDTARES